MSWPRSMIWRFLIGVVGFLALQSLIQTLWYYLGEKLGTASDIISAGLSFGILLALSMFPGAERPVFSPLPTTKQKPPTIKVRWQNFWRSSRWGIFCLVPALAAAFYILNSAWHAGTTEAIRTPWPLLRSGTLLAFALLGLSAWLAAWRAKALWSVVLISLLWIGLLMSISSLVYQLGFGFDGFLHRASQSVLLETGTLQPKPAYYIGQYVFTTWLTRRFALPLSQVDRWLVPVSSMLIPLFAWLYFRTKQALAPFALAFLPLVFFLQPFISTTPQAFAYVLGLASLATQLAQFDTKLTRLVSWLLSLWSIAVHPLAGLPFLGAVILIFWIRRFERDSGISSKPSFWHSWKTWAILFSTWVIIPLAFFINSRANSTKIIWRAAALFSWQTYDALFSSLLPPTTHYSLWADWATLLAYLAPLLVLACVGTAIWKDQAQRPTWSALLVLASGLVISGWILRLTADFSFLIDYERTNYADRLFTLAGLMLVFPAGVGGAYLMRRLLSTHAVFPLLCFLFFVGSWHAAQAYNTLPRHDAALSSHGWSVGAADVEAVRFIEQDAQSEAYTVLANQSVSAAAVEKLGFKRYAGEIFFYPLPTGGPLYQTYLKAVGSEPTTSTIREAAHLGQTSLVYVVLNDYWWRAEQIGEELAALAGQSFDIQKGKTRVFKFRVSE